MFQITIIQLPTAHYPLPTPISHSQGFQIWRKTVRRTLISQAAWSLSRGGYSSASAPRSISRCAEAAGSKAARAPIWPHSGRSSSVREDSRLLAPNLIELRYDYETYTRMGASRREFLQRELDANIYEYIYNRRYATLGEVQVRIAYDAFTRGLEIRTGFGEPRPPVVPQNAPAEAQAPGRAKGGTVEVVLQIEGGSRILRARVGSGAGPVGIGRNSANALIIDDSMVSNFHAALTISANGDLLLADRGSSNGTYVNGVTLETGGRIIIRDGDRLKFGDVEAALRISD
jgi:hypothetical protein